MFSFYHIFFEDILLFISVLYDQIKKYTSLSIYFVTCIQSQITKYSIDIKNIIFFSRNARVNTCIGIFMNILLTSMSVIINRTIFCSMPAHTRLVVLTRILRE